MLCTEVKVTEWGAWVGVLNGMLLLSGLYLLARGTLVGKGVLSCVRERSRHFMIVSNVIVWCRAVWDWCSYALSIIFVPNVFLCLVVGLWVYTACNGCLLFSCKVKLTFRRDGPIKNAHLFWNNFSFLRRSIVTSARGFSSQLGGGDWGRQANHRFAPVIMVMYGCLLLMRVTF